VDALATCGLASSKSEARRGIQGKGFAVNGEKTDDVERVLTPKDLLAGGFVMLQKGKKNYGLVRVR
jgi:tyrosyl-tRNA synthetase